MSRFITVLEAKTTEPPTSQIDERDVKYIDIDGVTNSYINYNGKTLRVRVEMLVRNDKGQILVEKTTKPTLHGDMYKLPGGSIEPNRTFMRQAIAEVNEEARIEVNGVQYSGIYYIALFQSATRPAWYKKFEKAPIKYDGAISFVYTGKYKGKYTGKIDPEDVDDFYKKARWYDIADVPLCEEHLNAIKIMNR